jgi:hypothetical protein
MSQNGEAGEKCNVRLNEPHKLRSGGLFARALPLFKWRRKDGEATFFGDLMALRKPIALCKGCERKMPYYWTSRYNYEFVKGYYAEMTACDYCRTEGSANFYHPVDGAYHQAMIHARKIVREVKARERAMYDRDRRYMIG